MVLPLALFIALFFAFLLVRNSTEQKTNITYNEPSGGGPLFACKALKFSSSDFDSSGFPAFLNLDLNGWRLDGLTGKAPSHFVKKSLESFQQH